MQTEEHTTTPVEGWLKLNAENRRLREELTKLRNNNVLITRLDIAEKTVLRQQTQLTQLNLAVQRRNKRIARQAQQLERYRTWAGATPVDADRSLMDRTERRLAAVRRANAIARTNTEIIDTEAINQ